MRPRMSPGRPARSPITRMRTPLLFSSFRSRRMNKRSRLRRSSTSAAGRDQFSELKLNKVRVSIPRFPAKRTARRTASIPRRCPSVRGSPRARAQRPFPSMMMATCRGAGSTAPVVSSTGFACAPIESNVPECVAYLSDLLDFLFFGRDELVDELDMVVGEFLDILRRGAGIVLAHLAVLFELLCLIHAVSADVADGDARLLSVFMRELDEFLATLRIQLRNRDAQEGTFHDRVEAEIGISDRAVDGVGQRTVPDLDRDHARFRDV